MKVIEGTIVLFGDNISANSILQPEHSLTREPISEKMVFPDLNRENSEQYRNADILVAGEKFGYGSVREDIVKALLQSGIKAIVGKGFAPAFFRNALNLGLPALTSREAVDSVQSGDRLQVAVEEQRITNLRTEQTFTADPIPDFARKIMEMGGVEAYMSELMKQS